MLQSNAAVTKLQSIPSMPSLRCLLRSARHRGCHKRDRHHGDLGLPRFLCAWPSMPGSFAIPALRQRVPSVQAVSDRRGQTRSRRVRCCRGQSPSSTATLQLSAPIRGLPKDESHSLQHGTLSDADTLFGLDPRPAAHRVLLPRCGCGLWGWSHPAGRGGGGNRQMVRRRCLCLQSFSVLGACTLTLDERAKATLLDGSVALDCTHARAAPGRSSEATCRTSALSRGALRGEPSCLLRVRGRRVRV